MPSRGKSITNLDFLSICNAFFGIMGVSITGGGTYDRATAENADDDLEKEIDYYNRRIDVIRGNEAVSHFPKVEEKKEPA